MGTQIYIALLRGINVGGRHALPMKELAALLEDLGARNVKTYIQSGNAILRSEEEDMALLSGKITAEIRKRRGFEPDVLLLESEDIEEAISANPFPGAESEPKTLHLGFLASTPSSPDIEALEGLKKASERFRLRDKVFYLHAPEGVGRSKLAAGAERLLGVSMTVRNWRTVCKIQELAQELDE